MDDKRNECGSRVKLSEAELGRAEQNVNYGEYINHAYAADGEDGKSSRSGHEQCDYGIMENVKTIDEASNNEMTDKKSKNQSHDQQDIVNGFYQEEFEIKTINNGNTEHVNTDKCDGIIKLDNSNQNNVEPNGTDISDMNVEEICIEGKRQTNQITNTNGTNDRSTDKAVAVYDEAQVVGDDGMVYDKGYSWVVLVAATAMYIIVGIQIGALGIFTVEFMEYFDISRSEASLISGSSQVIGPISGMY